MAFVGPLDAFNSQPIQTKVGTSQTNIFTTTSTKVTKDSSGKVSGGTTTVYYSANAGSYVPAATTTDGGKTWTHLKDSNGKEILGADAKKSLEQGALKTNTQAQVISATKKGPLGGGGLTPEEQKVIASSTKNNANKPEAGDQQSGAGADKSGVDEKSAVEEELKKESKEGTRKDYGDVKYPVNLNPTVQDCIKFSIFEYKAPGVQPGTSVAGSRIVSLVGGNPGFKTGKDRKILGTITLPIPGGINDSNSADWSGEKIDEFTRALANISGQTILGGADKGVAAASGEKSNALSGGGTDLKSMIVSKFAGDASGASNLISRQFGAVVNPNLELLFNGPSLRTFGFTFRMSPRSNTEARNIRKIIRFFKQAMSVKRSNSSLLLKAPHTFAISYVTSDEQHPYLNKFKECALTVCNVNYTPDGTYMTYKGDIDDRSMTAYELSLTFQELEPLFDDDYGNEKEITSIGF